MASILDAFSASGLTYKQVGDALGVSAPSAWRKVNGRQSVSDEERKILADLFGRRFSMQSEKRWMA